MRIGIRGSVVEGQALTAHAVEIYNCETQEPIKGITACQIELSATGPVMLHLQVLPTAVDLQIAAVENITQPPPATLMRIT